MCSSHLFIFQLIKCKGSLCLRLEDLGLLALESMNLVQIDSVLEFMKAFTYLFYKKQLKRRHVSQTAHVEFRINSFS